jgi:hypothetical protein
MARMGARSCSDTRRSANDAAAGTNVKAKSNAPVKASSTTCAMGRNIFPSIPVSVRIGR